MSDPVPANPTGKPIVFYSPHQDDETLFMGQAIAHHALAGREVHVVLLCNGALSGARAMLNGTASSGFWGGYHYPPREGYAPLSEDDFGLARTREFVAACAQLGVPAERVHLGRADAPAATSADLPDGISTSWATDVMQSWATRFAAEGWPSVGHYTMWWGDNHADHAALGNALKSLRSSAPAAFVDARWLVKPEQASAAGAAAYTISATYSAMAVQMARRAGWCYRSWQPPACYAVGYHSVSYFTGPENGTANYIVKP
ncbi:PIG-L deacetylase family protein [Actinomadura sp. WMMA1423]|uniref:PIG-L deacetylase family protein n=1 Tax=Actinomadura sp. WMMA1423 TaxID=2591108 RepID=UPI0011476D5C|nr:PIG-L family deacetylase [Actinomadura sp. WMMA1423]